MRLRPYALPIVMMALGAAGFIWVIVETSSGNKKPGVDERPSNEMIIHYDYKLNVACYTVGLSTSCVSIPKEDRK